MQIWVVRSLPLERQTWSRPSPDLSFTLLTELSSLSLSDSLGMVCFGRDSREILANHWFRWPVSRTICVRSL